MKKSEYIWMAVATMFCFLAHAVVVNQFNGWFCTDTDGYWLHAATFTGHDWSGVASKVSMFYAWGYSVVLIIPFLLSSDILVMSKIVVLLNSMFCALTVPLLFSIGKKFFKETDSRVVIVAALITSLYPAYFLNSAVALAEAFIYFLYVLLMWLVLQYLQTEKYHWAVLSGVCCGYLYITHHRNLGMVVAYVILAVALFVKNRKWKEFLVFMIPLIVMLLIEMSVTEWLNAKEMLGAAYTTNTYGAMGKKAIRLLSLKGIIFAIQSAVGSIWYVLVGTFAMGGVGTMHLISYVAKRIDEESVKKTICDKMVLFYGYTFLNFILMLGVSVVSCARTTNIYRRMDIVFYGRYFECTICMLILFGVISVGCIRDKRKKEQELKIILLMIVCLSLLTYFFTQEITGADINYFSVAAVLFPFSHPNAQFSVFATSAFSICIVYLIKELILSEVIEYRILSYFLLGCCFCYVGYSGTINTREIYMEYASVVNYPVYNEEFNAINQVISEREAESLCVYANDGYETFSYQLFHPNMKIVSVNSVEELEIQTCEYVLVPKSVVGEANNAEIVLETMNYMLYK